MNCCITFSEVRFCWCQCMMLVFVICVLYSIVQGQGLYSGESKLALASFAIIDCVAVLLTYILYRFCAWILQVCFLSLVFFTELIDLFFYFNLQIWWMPHLRLSSWWSCTANASWKISFPVTVTQARDSCECSYSAFSLLFILASICLHPIELIWLKLPLEWFMLLLLLVCSQR